MSNREPIRVLQIITRMILGGAQEHALLLAEGLDRLPDYEVTFISGVDQGREGELLSRTRETTHLIVVPELGRNINPFSDVVALWKLYCLIRRGRYHVVNTHSSKAGVLGRIAAKMAGTPIVVHTLHGLGLNDYQPWVINRLWWAVKKFCAPMTDHYASVSNIISQKAINLGIARPEKFSTIYTGMELDWFLNAKVDPLAVRREFGIPPDALVVGKVARLVAQKGHEHVVAAAPEIVKRYPQVRFLFVGDGDCFEQVRESARALGLLDNFVFAGLVPRERIPEMIAAMDVFIHMGLWEGLPRVLPQALAMGKPCVAFDVDGNPEVVIPGKTGYLVRAGDTVELAEAVSRLLGDPQLRARMGESGRRQVDPAFRTETMVRETAALYARLMKQHAKRVARFDKQHSRHSEKALGSGSF